MDQRRQQLENWLKNKLNKSEIDLKPLIADASFRRYFRLQHDGQSYLAMDSPPDLEPCDSFVAVAKLLKQAGLTVPHIFHQDQQQGFLLITDFGDELLLNTVTPDNAHQLYTRAMDELLLLQSCLITKEMDIPTFDADFMGRELENFRHWFLGEFLQNPLTPVEQRAIDTSLQWIIKEAFAQPQVFVHRDYHSRNLMVLTNQDIGIIDFQDAVIGPISYDLVSLLRDCYIAWPVEQVEQWLTYFYQGVKQQIQDQLSLEQFKHGFDVMGMQRHLKASFIFVRKFLRDDDDRYLADVPRTLNYVQAAANQYHELEDFATILSQKLIPKFHHHYETRKLTQE